MRASGVGTARARVDTVCMLALRRLAAYAIDWSLFALWATGIVAIVLLIYIEVKK